MIIGTALLAAALLAAEAKELPFPIPDYFQQVAAQGGNPRPDTGTAYISLPPEFTPAKSWPILIVTSTSDFGRTSIMDAPAYREPANAEGWIVFATDATIKPRIDSTTWRLGVLSAGLEMLRKQWPQSAKWPITFAGFSGGAKRSCEIGAMLGATGTSNIRGFFLAGISEDRLSEAFRTYKPRGNFLDVPVWLSSGTADDIASPQAHQGVRASLQRTGFRNVRLEPFAGGHQIKRREVQRALRWFREVGGF